MTKPRVFWLAYAACVGLAVFWGVRLLTPPHRINRENYDKIQIGMSLEEVEAILGVRAGNYATRKYAGTIWKHVFIIEDCHQWIANEGTIAVRLDAENKVSKHAWGEAWPTDDEAFLGKLCGWMGLKDWKMPTDSMPMPPDW